MAAVKKQVECIAKFDIKGNPTPIRIRYEERDERKVVKVARILQRDMRKSAMLSNGSMNRQYSFKCETEIDGRVVPFELRYETENQMWSLYI